MGGQYFFTVDEIEIRNEILYLIESKHTKSGKLPSTGDIKDGLLKMILYTNLENVSMGNSFYKCLPILQLTSGKIEGKISSISEIEDRERFFHLNKLNKRQIGLLQNLFLEAKENNFIVSLGRI